MLVFAAGRNWVPVSTATGVRTPSTSWNSNRAIWSVGDIGVSAAGRAIVTGISLTEFGSSWTPTVVTIGRPSLGIATKFSSLTSQLIAMNGACVIITPPIVAI